MSDPRWFTVCVLCLIAASVRSADVSKTRDNAETNHIIKNGIIKREAPGTCTCTCETKLVKDGKDDEAATGNGKKERVHQMDSINVALNDESAKNTEDQHGDTKAETKTSSRISWKDLPDYMCFRRTCSTDADCCYRYNICDRSALVCTDCWYGSPCKTDADCCKNHPRCLRSYTRYDGSESVAQEGQCVSN